MQGRRPFTCRNGAARSNSGTGQRAHYLVAERDGAVRGVLPLTEIRSRLFGNALVSAGFATGGGALAEDERTAATLADAAWDAGAVARLPDRRAARRRRPRGLAGERRHLCQFHPRAARPTRRPCSRIIPRRQRAEVRRALAFELETTAGTDRRHRDAHYRVYAESVRNLGTPVFPRALFEAALDEFGDEADIVVVWKDGRPLAALLNFYLGNGPASLSGAAAPGRRGNAAPTTSSITS